MVSGEDMSEKRKVVLMEGLFLVPFLLIATVISLVLMFGIGRNFSDIVELSQEYLTADSSMDITEYEFDEDKGYKLKYYYGESEQCTEFANYSQKSNKDGITYELTLLEARDGFDAGYYKTEWFHSEEYITYAPIEDKNKTTSYPVDEQPYMYNYVKSYSYETLLNDYSALSSNTNGYSILGIVKLYVWETNGRVNCIWGIANKPIQFYTKIDNGTEEYKKVVFK